MVGYLYGLGTRKAPNDSILDLPSDISRLQGHYRFSYLTSGAP